MKKYTTLLALAMSVALHTAYAQDEVAQDTRSTNSIDTHSRVNVSDVLWHGSVFGTMNMHEAKFTQLAGVSMCCAEFTNMTGIGGGLYVGVERDFDNRFMGMPWRYGGNLSYSLLSGTFKAKENIGNVIHGQQVTKGVSEHALEVGYSVVGVEPYVNLNLPLGNTWLKAGVIAGVPMSTGVDVSETLIDPSGSEYTFENDSKVRNIQEASLDDALFLYAALTLGLRYDIEVNPGLLIAPEVQYNFSLTPVAQNTTWSINTIRAGIVVSVRDYEVIAAPAPPPPPPPPPVVAKVPALSLNSSLKVPSALSTASGVATIANITEDVITVEMQAAPIVLFQAGTTTPLPTTTQGGDLQQSVMSAVKQYLEENPSAQVVLEGHVASDEPDTLAQARVTWATNQLGSLASRVTTKTIQNSEVRYPQLREEHRSLRIFINGTGKILTVKRSDTLRKSPDVDVLISNTLVCEASPCNVEVSAVANGIDVPVREQNGSYIATLSGLQLKDVTARKVIVKVEATDTDGKSVSTTSSITVQPTMLTRNVEKTRFFGPTSLNETSTTWVLGYFGFDANTFMAENPEAVVAIKAAKLRGDEIAIIPQTDDLGTVEYNEELQKRRGRAALRSLGFTQNDATIIIGPPALKTDGSSTPVERVLSRCVYVRITPKVSK